MVHSRRSSLAIVSGLALLPLLAACGMTPEEAETARSIPYSVQEVDKNGIFDYSSWAVQPAGVGEPIAFKECTRPDLFSKITCTTADGLYELTYSTHKGKVRRMELTFDGKVQPLACARESLAGLRVCTPKE
jgi:hypothetical protein